MQAYRAMSEPSDDQRRRREGLPTHIPVPEEPSSGGTFFGVALSFISILLLSFILRLAVPVENSAVEMAVLLIATGFAQIWLIFFLLKSIRK